MQEKVSRGFSIDVDKGEFIKWGPFVFQEFQNTQLSYKLSKESNNLFRVPRPISFDKKSNKLRFEFISGLKELSKLDHEEELKRELVYKAGKSLAYVHMNASKTVNQRHSIKYKFNVEDKFIGFIHGDFNLQNVQYNNEDLVIVDWQLSPLFDNPANYGCFFQDVYWFIRSLIFTNTTQFLRKKSQYELCKVFLDSYLKATKFPFKSIVEFAYHFENLSLVGKRGLKSRINKQLLNRQLAKFWKSYNLSCK